MAKIKVKTLTDNKGENFYPLTHGTAVVNDQGVNMEDRMTHVEDTVEQKSKEQAVFFETTDARVSETEGQVAQFESNVTQEVADLKQAQNEFYATTNTRVQSFEDDVEARLAEKAKIGVVDETGDSKEYVMSQAAVTRELTELESKVDSSGSIKEDVTSDFSITDENGQQIVKFESGEVKTKKFSSAKTVNIEDDDNDLSISDVNGNDIIKINDGGIETKKFKSSNKKEYTPKYERFSVYINKTPVGKFDDKSPRKDGDKPEAIVSVKGIIALPKTYTPNGEPCRLLLFAHGSSGNVTDTEWYNNKSSFINDFIPFWLSQGYAVFDCNAVPDGEARLSNGASTLSNPIGLPDNMQAYLKSYEYIVNNYNVKPQMYVWACSAGGPVPLNFLFMRNSAIAAIAECGGILDIKDEIWGQSGQYPSDHRPDLAKRLGFDDLSGNTWEHDKADIWNPYSRIKEIDGKQYAFGFNAPIYILHGTNDTVLYQFEKRNTFADALINGGSICVIKWYDGFTHDDVCMGEKHIVMEDVCKWFNRF